MVKKGTCGLCQGGCAVVYTIENGKIVKVEPDKESPKGRLCPRGALVPDILYGEERIKRPLSRVGERGEGKFREWQLGRGYRKAAELTKENCRYIWWKITGILLWTRYFRASCNKTLWQR